MWSPVSRARDSHVPLRRSSKCRVRHGSITLSRLRQTTCRVRLVSPPCHPTSVLLSTHPCRLPGRLPGSSNLDILRRGLPDTYSCSDLSCKYWCLLTHLIPCNIHHIYRSILPTANVQATPLAGDSCCWLAVLPVDHVLAQGNTFQNIHVLSLNLFSSCYA